MLPHIPKNLAESQAASFFAVIQPNLKLLLDTTYQSGYAQGKVDGRKEGKEEQESRSLNRPGDGDMGG